LATILSLNSREVVLKAIDEFDRFGRDAFFATYGYGPSRSYLLEYRGRRYDSKAIAGMAWGLQHFGDGQRRPDNYTGGKHTSVRALEKLKFKIVAGRASPAQKPARSPQLQPGTEYSSQEVAESFGFAPGLFSRAGGMISRPDVNSLLLISNPRKGGAIYRDEWEPDGNELIYAGKGLKGNQRLVGENRMVAENTRELLLFESQTAGRLLFHGKVSCVDVWTSRDPDKLGNDRRVYRFRLRLEGRRTRTSAKRKVGAGYRQRDPSSFKRRPFDPDRKAAKRRHSVSSDPENRDALIEQADAAHQATLKVFGLWLGERGWSELEEEDGASDLLASQPPENGGRRVLFEIKSIRPGTERNRVRSGLAQLLEYRLRFGHPSDMLCLVTNRSIPRPQQQLLDTLDIGHVYLERATVQISGTRSSRAIFLTSSSYAEARPSSRGKRP
jgi:hypothetical protein